ncbi:MAG: nucleotidyltransferase domain-containing protein [bacterium]|nr:nucleotidyltransferase domain-containing protein [bacterium]
MPFLYNIGFGENKRKKLLLGNSELKSLVYHNIFDYPLTEREIVKWVTGSKVKVVIKDKYMVEQKNGLYFLKDKEGVVYKRLLNKRVSARKIQVAKKTANLISAIPAIKLIAITGSLAMENASDDSDIDLLIVTKSGSLWTTRLITLIFLKLLGVPVRRFKDKKQKDKLCINIWLDESDLSWSTGERNSYTAHEIAQIKPLLNRNGTYEKFMADNVWIKDYWPNAVKITKEPRNKKTKEQKSFFSSLFLNFFNLVVEKLAFRIQHTYMKKKITREVVTPTSAIFHPNDWSEVVLRQLSP